MVISLMDDVTIVSQDPIKAHKLAKFLEDGDEEHIIGLMINEGSRVTQDVVNHHRQVIQNRFKCEGYMCFENVGLRRNKDKCEMFGGRDLTEDEKERMREADEMQKNYTREGFKIVGAPFGADNFTTTFMAKKLVFMAGILDHIKRLGKIKLNGNPPKRHALYYILRVSVSVHFHYLMRCITCAENWVKGIHIMIQDTLCYIHDYPTIDQLSVGKEDLKEHIRRRIHLPCGMGGMGIPNLVVVNKIAFLASFAMYANHLEALHPTSVWRDGGFYEEVDKGVAKDYREARQWFQQQVQDLQDEELKIAAMELCNKDLSLFARLRLDVQPRKKLQKALTNIVHARICEMVDNDLAARETGNIYGYVTGEALNKTLFKWQRSFTKGKGLQYGALIGYFGENKLTDQEMRFILGLRSGLPFTMEDSKCPKCSETVSRHVLIHSLVCKEMRIRRSGDSSGASIHSKFKGMIKHTLEGFKCVEFVGAHRGAEPQLQDFPDIFRRKGEEREGGKVRADHCIMLKAEGLHRDIMIVDYKICNPFAEGHACYAGDAGKAAQVVEDKELKSYLDAWELVQDDPRNQQLLIPSLDFFGHASKHVFEMIERIAFHVSVQEAYGGVKAPEEVKEEMRMNIKCRFRCAIGTFLQKQLNHLCMKTLSPNVVLDQAFERRVAEGGVRQAIEREDEDEARRHGGQSKTPTRDNTVREREEVDVVLQGVISEVEKRWEVERLPFRGHTRRVMRGPIRMPVPGSTREQEREIEGSEESDEVTFIRMGSRLLTPSQEGQGDEDSSRHSYVQFPEDSQESSVTQLMYVGSPITQSSLSQTDSRGATSTMETQEVSSLGTM